MREKRNFPPQMPEEAEGQLEGRNALTEALRSGRTIDKVFIASGETDRALQRLAAQAKEAGAVVVPVDRRKLDAMSTTHAHQGVIALAAAREYATLDDLLENAADKGEAPLLVICDELTDPHNLGAAIADLKEKGVWIFGTAAEGSIPMYQADLTIPAAIVIGNEGSGMSPLVRKNCDVTVHIPMKGNISSLNASCAASVLLYEALRQRLQK